MVEHNHRGRTTYRSALERDSVESRKFRTVEYRQSSTYDRPITQQFLVTASLLGFAIHFPPIVSAISARQLTYATNCFRMKSAVPARIPLRVVSETRVVTIAQGHVCGENRTRKR